MEVTNSEVSPSVQSPRNTGGQRTGSTGFAKLVWRDVCLDRLGLLQGSHLEAPGGCSHLTFSFLECLDVVKRPIHFNKPVFFFEFN